MSSRSSPLLTYSMVKALYDEGADYVDSFWPFLLHVLPKDKSPLPILAAAKLIEDRFGLVIPQHTLRTIAERARRKRSLLSRERELYALTDQGITYVMGSETERDVQRRIAALVADAQVFLKARYALELGAEETRRLIERVIDGNLALFDFLVDKPPLQPLPGTHAVTEEAVLAYFQKVDEEKPAVHATLRDLICGTVISSLLRRTDIADARRKFRTTRLYLDANTVLSLLDLRFPAQAQPTQELFRLVIDAGYFDLAVLNFTMEEMIELLRGYDAADRIYPTEVHVNSIYASMRVRGLSVGDARELIADLPSRLAKLGISVIRTGWTLDTIPGQSPEILRELSRYKPGQPHRAQLHDLQAIDFVRLERRATATRVEDGKVYFLTEDVRLSNYAYVALGHKRDATISEVMPDRLLTNLLWLKNPRTLQTMSLGSIIAMHSRDLFINRRVWGRFHELVNQLEKAGEVDDDAASVLLYDGQVHKDLALLGAEGPEDVDREWILDRLEGARERRRDVEEAHLASQEARLRAEHQTREAELLGQVDRAKDEAAQSKALLAQAGRSAVNIAHARARRWARGVVLAVRSALALALGLAVIQLVPALLDRWALFEPLFTIASWVLALILVVVGVKLELRTVFHGLESVLARRFTSLLAEPLKPVSELVGNESSELETER